MLWRRYIVALSEKKKASNKKYQDEHIKRVSLVIQNDLHDRIMKRLENTGESKNGFIVSAILEKLERDGD